MLNRIWCLVIILGIIFATLQGKINVVSTAFLDGAKDAVDIFLLLLGTVSMWNGMITIAERSGLVKLISQKIMPLLKFLFPTVPPKDKAMDYIALNMAANFFGLGWAATPSGIMAVKELDRLNKKKATATNAMCMFLVINMSSIQLISINIISYRMKYGSLCPDKIVFPGIIATAVSTITAVWLCKLCERR